MRPFGSQVYAADYFAEDVKRTLEANFGEDGVKGRMERGAVCDGTVNGGPPSGPRSIPTFSAWPARHSSRASWNSIATRAGADPSRRSARAGDWGAVLADIPVPGEVAPWRLGIVLDVQKHEGERRAAPVAAAGQQPARQARDRRACPWKRCAGPRRLGRTPRVATDVLQVGDVIWVSPKDPQRPSATWSLMQIPEIDGGLIAMDPHTGRVLAVVGGFAFAGNQFDRALLGKRQPGPCLSRSSTRRHSTTATSRPTRSWMSPSRSTWAGAGRPGRPRTTKAVTGSGPTPLRAGIEQSRNLMTVRLAQAMGFSVVGEYAKRFDLYDKKLTDALACARLRRDHPCCECAPPMRRSPMAAGRSSPR